MVFIFMNLQSLHAQFPVGPATKALSGNSRVSRCIIPVSVKMMKVSEELFEKWMRKRLDKFDILLTSEAPLGELHILMAKEKYVLSQRLFAIRANENQIKPIYLYFYCNYSGGKFGTRTKSKRIANVNQR